MTHFVSRLLQESAHTFLFISPQLFIFGTLLITALMLKRKLTFSTLFIVSIAATLFIEIIYIFLRPAAHFLLRSQLNHTEFAVVIISFEMFRNVLLVIFSGVIFYELVIGKLKLVSPLPPPRTPIKTIRLQFTGEVGQAFKYIVLVVISSITIIPLAWAISALNRWLVRSTLTTEGASGASFTGRGGDVWGWFLGNGLLFIVIYVCSLAAGIAAGEMRVFNMLLIALVIMFLPLSIFFGYRILRWSIESIRTEQGISPQFAGNFVSLIGFQLLIAVSALTVIGWAWVYAAFFRWICRNSMITGYQVRFTGKGSSLLGIYLIVGLGSLLIIPIPFLMIWSLKWHLERIEIDRLAEQ